MLTMVHAVGPTFGRAAAVVPAALLIIFIGLVWLLGLACGKDRREYVTKISEQAMNAISLMFQGGSRTQDPPLPGTSDEQVGVTGR